MRKRKRAFYGKVIVSYIDIDGKDREYSIICYNESSWLKRFYYEWELLTKMKNEGEVIDFHVTATR